LILRILEFFPSERVHHAGFDSVRIAGVPVIVETPNHQIMVGDEFSFRDQNRVGLFFRQLIGNIEMIEECRFVSDDEIVACGSGALRHIECGHHGHGNP